MFVSTHIYTRIDPPSDQRLTERQYQLAVCCHSRHLSPANCPIVVVMLRFWSHSGRYTEVLPNTLRSHSGRYTEGFNSTVRFPLSLPPPAKVSLQIFQAIRFLILRLISQSLPDDAEIIPHAQTHYFSETGPFSIHSHEDLELPPLGLPESNQF